MCPKWIATALALTLVACGNAPVQPSSNLNSNTYSISPVFETYYAGHGGVKILGDPISAEVIENGATVQYFQNARLEYHSQLPPENQIFMTGLGEQIYGRSPCVPAASAELNTLYFNDCHSVSQEFRDFFEKYGGVAFFGYPISERYIYSNWLAQNYERATVIWDPSKPMEYQYSLLPLGALSCPTTTCNGLRGGIVAPPPSTSTVEPTPTDPLYRYYADHGGLRVFGQPLTGVRQGEDGAREQVFENAILYENPFAPEGVSLRPLGILTLGGAEPPALPLNGPNTGFFTQYGHNISYAIYNFYKTYGGEAVFGQPITEWRADETRFVQYFENIAVTQRFNLPLDQSVQLIDLGRQSLGAQSISNSRSAAPQLLVVATEPLHDILQNPAADEQTLKARVLDENGLPVSGAKVTFVVHTPEGDMELVGKTDSDGYALYSFKLASYSAGGFMLYSVTAEYENLSATVSASFVTWGALAP
jgi:hypothetical protein